MKNDNVIDLAKHRRKTKSNKPSTVSEAPVVDMTERRQEIIKSERRAVKRTILTEFIGAFAVIPQQGLLKVSVYDISEEGIAFDIDIESGGFKKGEEIAMRVYMNQQTYFPFVIKVKNARDVLEDGVCRHGASFMKDTVNHEALNHFVKFIETVSASLERDHGDIMVSNLKK